MPSWLNAPNTLTALRLVLAAPIIVLLYSYDRPIWALFVTLLAALSDYLDGKIARDWGANTELGEFLDPAADKAFCLTVLALALVHYGVVSWILPAVIVIAIYDIAATLMRLGGIVATTSRIAKWKTAILMAALHAFFIAIIVEETVFAEYGILGFIALLWLAGIFTVFSGYNYVRTGLVGASRTTS